MKKFSTLLIAALLVLTASASARQSRVILNNESGCSVGFNERIYNKDNDNISIVNLQPGTYTLKLYAPETAGKKYNQKEKQQFPDLQFSLLNEDVQVNISAGGNIHINQEGNRGSRITTRRPRSNRNYDDDENNDWNQKRSDEHEQIINTTRMNKRTNSVKRRYAKSLDAIISTR